MPTYSWFTPGEGIAREVISADIQRYLGRDAVVKPGEYQGVEGYLIAADRNLTSEMIRDLQRATHQWHKQGGRYKDSDVYKQARGIPINPTPAVAPTQPYVAPRDSQPKPRYQHGTHQYYEQQHNPYEGYQQQPTYPYQQQPTYPYSPYGATPQPSSYVPTPAQQDTTNEQTTPGQSQPRTIYPATTTTTDRTDPRMMDPRWAAYYAAHGNPQPTPDQYTPSTQPSYYDPYAPTRR